MKQLIAERDALTLQWKEAIKMMHQRDNDVVHVQEQILTTLEIIQKQNEKLVDENDFLNNEKRNNHDLDLELQNKNAINSKLRRDLIELSNHILFLTGEVKVKFID